MKNIRILLLVLAAGATLWLFADKPASADKAVMSAAEVKLYSAEKGDYFQDKSVVRSEEAWKKLLTAEQYHILREQGTERAFTGKYWNHHEHGIYRCAGCGLDLYRSEHKYESGTGWPSYYQPVADENVSTRPDNSFFTIRNELICSRCGGHLGHVFDDGPKPTGKRHCINSEALIFHPLEDERRR